MKNKCTIALLLVTTSFLLIIFSLFIMFSFLSKKIEESNKKITHIETMLSDLQIEKIEYVQN